MNIYQAGKAKRFYNFNSPGKKKSPAVAFLAFLVHLLFTTTYNLNGQPPFTYPSLSFHNPVLISGTDLQVNAVYKFPNVISGVDVHVTIMGMSGGAWLSEIDNTTGAGYYDAFQPYVGAGANDTSYIDWKFVFKKAGTFTDTILPLLAVTGVDVDGNGSNLKEFIEASTPGSFSLDPNTNLSFTFDGIRSTAISTTTNYPQIDTANKPSMFQMNFTNINTILYRNGAINTGNSQVRQTSIYFKSFFMWPIALPLKIISFYAKENTGGIDLHWTASDDRDINHYTVEKSPDGKKWKAIYRVRPDSNSNPSSYIVTDTAEKKSLIYYRIAQVNLNATKCYSNTIMLHIADDLSTPVITSYVAGNKINLRIKTKTNDDLICDLYTITGAKVMSVPGKVSRGTNECSLLIPATSGKGIYLVIIRNSSGQVIYRNKILWV